MLTIQAFITLVKKIKSFDSITGKASYYNCIVEGDVLHFIRKNTGKPRQINLNEAYAAYMKEQVINTIILRNYMRSRVYSPTLGLLIAMGLYNDKGVRN